MSQAFVFLAASNITREVYAHLLGPHEQQVLHRMSGTRHVLDIAEAPHVHVQRGTRLVRVGIVDEEDFEFIGEGDDPVRPVVECGPFQVLYAFPCYTSEWFAHAGGMLCSSIRLSVDTRPYGCWEG